MKKLFLGSLCIALCATLMTGCEDDGGQVVDVPQTNPGLPNGPATTGQILAGRYLVTTSGCADCHNRGTTNPNDPNWLAGSLVAGDQGEFDIAGNKIYARNLTPHAASGLGNWTITEVFNALRQGKDKEGGFLCPPMPWPEYQNMTDDDIWSIVAYLKSIKAVNNVVPENAAPGGGAVDPNIFFPAGAPPKVPPYPAANEIEVTNTNGSGLPLGAAIRDQVLRGRYLVTSANDCNACHSVNGNNPGDPSYLAGFVNNATVNPRFTGRFNLGPAITTFARNLTPDASGLGNFTNQEIFNAMRNGADKREGGVLKPPMPWPALHNLSDADTWAIVAYLRSVKPVANTVPTDVVPPGFPGFNTTALPLPNYPGSNEVP